MLPLLCHGRYADGTDRQTPDCYIMLSAIRSQRGKSVVNPTFLPLTIPTKERKVIKSMIREVK